MKETIGKNGNKLKTFTDGDKKLANSGRTKGTPNAKTRLAKLLQLSHTQINAITGNEENADIAFFIDVALLKKALGGDIAAYKEVTDRIDGKSVESQRQVDKEGNDITPINIHLFSKEELLAHLNDK